MIQLLIVDSAHLTCSIMAAALGNEPDLGIAGCATTVQGMMAQARDAEVVLLSATLGGVKAVEMTRAALTANPAARVLLVGLPDSEELIVEGIEAGMAGYVLREATLDDLVASIRAAHRGQAIVSPEMAGLMMRHASRLAEMYCGRRLLGVGS